MTASLRLFILAAILCFDLQGAMAQDGETEGPLEPLSTLFSIKVSGGYGLGRARQLYGSNGSDPVYWSAGEGVIVVGICLCHRIARFEHIFLDFLLLKCSFSILFIIYLLM